jgi:hypothetical protein
MCCGSKTRCCTSKAPEPADDANATLTLTRDIFVKMIAGTAGVKDTLLSDDLKIGGSKIDLVRFFGLIDKAPGTFAIVTLLDLRRTLCHPGVEAVGGTNSVNKKNPVGSSCCPE